MELKDKTAIVTGVSSGIGKAVVKEFLKKGMKVCGWSRNDPEISNPDFLFVKTDIRKNEAVEKSFKNSMEFLQNSIDVLINNAGVGYFSKTEDLPLEKWHQMFDTNVHGMFYTTRVALPVMRKQKRGHIINLASIAGLSGINEAAGYCATKFAVRGFSQSLFKEVRQDNIKVTTICPGSVNTDFFQNIESIRANETMLSSEDIASAIMHVLQTPDNCLTVEMEMRPMRPRYT